MAAVVYCCRSNEELLASALSHPELGAFTDSVDEELGANNGADYLNRMYDYVDRGFALPPTEPAKTARAKKSNSDPDPLRTAFKELFSMYSSVCMCRSPLLRYLSLFVRVL